MSGLQITHLPGAILNLYNGRRILHLDLSCNRLKSIEGLAYFRQLESLILDNNQLTMIGAGLDEFSRPVAVVNSRLKVLSVNNNRITNLDAFLKNISHCFPNLTYLSLLRNPCCPDNLSTKWTLINPWLTDPYLDYQLKCKKTFPRLQFLDYANFARKSMLLEKRNGSVDRILENLIRFKDGLIEVFTLDDEEDASLAEIAFPPRPPGDHHGTYFKSRMEYVGRNSEGNRFIRNENL